MTTEKAKRIAKTLDELNLRKEILFTLDQLDEIARRARVERIEVMIYLRRYR